MLLLPPGSAIEIGPQDITAQLRPNHYANLPRIIINNYPKYRYFALAPSVFEAPTLGR